MSDIYSFYPFDPVIALPWVFTGIIAVAGIINFYQNFIYWRWFHFGWILTPASLVWTAGFICRGISQAHPYDLGIYIAQYILIFLGPSLFGASETFILGRLMAYLPYATPMHPGRVVTTFLLLSAVVDGIGSAGTSNVASAADGATIDEHQLSNGLKLMEAALLLQCCIELLFLSVTARVHYNASKVMKLPRHVKIIMSLLYITSTMLLARCIFRVVEAFQLKTCLTTGNCGASITQQAYFWIFDVANITVFIILLTIFTPGRYLPNNYETFLDKRDGITELRGPGFAKMDKRPLLVTILDPFSLASVVRGKGMKVHPFWEDNWPAFEGDKRPYYKHRKVDVERPQPITSESEEARRISEGDEVKRTSEGEEPKQ